MGFNPFNEKGVPLERQVDSWSELNVKPYDSTTVHPYTRTRGILMNGIEVEAVFFYHNFHRHAEDMELRRQLAVIRRAEQQEQKMVNWAIPAQESTIEVTIGYEQLAVDLTAAMAKTEPDQYVKAALDFALIEDFDHLYRYANLLQQVEEKRAESIVKNLTEITPGRPTITEHIHPLDSVRNYYDKQTASMLTKLHVATIIAAEQQTMNFYMNVGNRSFDTVARGLYQEIAQIEEQHVTHYGSLQDPRASWFEMAVLHEYNECYMYWSCMRSEPDERMRKMWQRHLEYEITHLHTSVELAKKYEQRDYTEQFSQDFPQPLVLEPNKDYVRTVIAQQMHYTADMNRFVPMSHNENRNRYETYQKTINSGNYTPSQQIVQNTINTHKQDYRFETEGANPVEILRSRTEIPTGEQIINYSLSK